MIRLTFNFKTEHTYAVVDESRVARQQRRPRPQVGAVRPEQPAERHIQQIQPRIEPVSTTAATHQSSDTRRRANSDKDTHLTKGTDEAFKPKKKRPASWPSINEPRVMIIKPSKTVDQELRRVYDSVALPKAQPVDGAVGDMEYNKLSYKGYPKKEMMSPSLDALPLSSMYSRLNTSNDPFQAPAISKLSASSHSVPDIEEKRETTPAKRDAKPKEIVEPVRQEQVMTEDDVALSPLYSNVNGNMHPVLSKQNQSTPPMYSVPDMKKKREARKLKREHSDQELVLQVRQIPPQNEAHTSAPLYSNVSEEMSKMQGQSHSVSDTEKQWERQQKMREKSEGGLVKAEERAQQVNELPAHHTTFSSSLLYSNLMEEKMSAPTAPIYSVPDMDKKRKERKAKNDKGPKNAADQANQAYPMKELQPRDRSLTSAPLYSNMDIEISAVQCMPDQSTPMYSVPDVNKKRQERLAQIKEGRQCVQRNASSPSLPPIPPHDITDSIHGQSTTFDITELEPMYPHVSVPSYLKKVKPMPSDNASEEADKAHLYDFPRRKDIYKPLPLEGFYDFPSSKPQFVNEAGLHYDVPSSLSLTERSGTDMQGPIISHEMEQQNLDHRGKTKRK